MKKLKSLISPKSVLNVFKVLHFIMKLFGLFPFKLKPTRNGPKPVFCVWGLIFTTIHFIIYYYCFFVVMDEKIHISGLNASMYKTIVDKFGTQVLLVMDGITIFCIFSSVFLNFKAQINIFSICCQAENRLRDKEFNLCFDIELLKLFGFSFILLLNLLNTFLCSVKFFIEIFNFKGKLTYLLVRILPHFYIQLKTSQFVLYVLMLHLGFNGLNNGIITKLSVSHLPRFWLSLNSGGGNCRLRFLAHKKKTDPRNLNPYAIAGKESTVLLLKALVGKLIISEALIS